MWVAKIAVTKPKESREINSHFWVDGQQNCFFIEKFSHKRWSLRERGFQEGKKNRKKNILGDDGLEWDSHREGVGEQQEK